MAKLFRRLAGDPGLALLLAAPSSAHDAGASQALATAATIVFVDVGQGDGG